jgi:hypothetical protein
MARSGETPRRLVVGLAVALAVTGLWATSTADPALSAYNPGWDGSSTLRGEIAPVGGSVVVGEGMSAYNTVTPAGTVAFVLSPDRRYTDDEAARLRAFVRRGGTLVVAEDFGPHTNPLLDRIGASTRVDGRPLRDGYSYYRSPSLAVATGVAESDLTTGVDRLTLNRGTALEPNGAQVLVESSPLAYVDANRNATLDRAESMGPHPVVTVEQVGEGRAVVVADPSVFINAMLERPGNRQFALALVTGAETVLLDYSHAETVPPLVRVALAIRQNPAIQALTVLAAAGVVVFLARRLPPGWTRETEQPPPGVDRRDQSATGVISSDGEGDDE